MMKANGIHQSQSGAITASDILSFYLLVAKPLLRLALAAARNVSAG